MELVLNSRKDHIEGYLGSILGGAPTPDLHRQVDN